MDAEEVMQQVTAPREGFIKHGLGPPPSAVPILFWCTSLQILWDLLIRAVAMPFTKHLIMLCIGTWIQLRIEMETLFRYRKQGAFNDQGLLVLLGCNKI